MKKILTLIATMVLIAESYGSIFYRNPDLILVNGEDEVIWEYPMDDYLKYFCDETKVVEFDQFCSTNRPYLQCTWVIQEGNLYLVKVALPTKEYPLTKFFPEAKERVLATWYSGTIRYHSGRLIGQYYDSLILEKDIVYHISEGKVTKLNEIDVRESSLAYAKQFLSHQFPLAEGNCPELYEGPSKRKKRMTAFLQEAIQTCGTGDSWTSYELPLSVEVKISANVDEFNYKRSYGKLSCYELLKLMSEETGTSLDISFTEGKVIYEIK
ncbi:hypothetical protein P4C99_21465 [Pontiellaceae bacterium B1224]|nr:hypothetical protein [Pontiellaceae bacterium B1224]